MSTAKRRINFTGRKRIPRERIDIRMLETPPGESLKATASLGLNNLGFPESAAVAVEGYYRSSSMRFNCGTVGRLRIPPVLELDEVDRSGSVLFRVKVIDREENPGKLLGAAHGIKPLSHEDNSGKESLFPIIHRDLGNELWRVEINEAGPDLVLNNRIPGFTYRILQNPVLQGTLLPAALRIVLQELVENPESEEGEDSWKEKWLQFCETTLGLDLDEEFSSMNEEEKEEWVDEAVRIFCEKQEFIQKIRTAQEEGS